MESKNSSSLMTSAKPFIKGGLSGCFATCCIQPIDMVKVQLQLVGEGGSKFSAVTSRNPFTVASNLIRQDGFLSLYRGLDAGLMRQITYTTARTGLFRVFSDAMTQYDPPAPGTDTPKAKPLPFYKKAVAGLASGALGSFIGNPCDLSLIRMQADNTLPPSQRRGYTGIFNALYRITKEEGVFSLWRGSTPTILRAMMLNAAMFSSSDQLKEYLVPKFGNTLTTSLMTSAFAGFCAATISLPFDFIKTRLQKMKADPVTGEFPYRNVLDCAIKVARNESILRFYSGYLVYCFRVGPHAMITLFCIDILNRFY